VSYQVALSSSAIRELNVLPLADRARVSTAIDHLKLDPRHPGVRKLKGFRDLYRARVGSLRVVFRIDDSARVVSVATIGPRRDVYRRLP
jgi:mRNA interferase RelE/StbE